MVEYYPRKLNHLENSMSTGVPREIGHAAIRRCGLPVVEQIQYTATTVDQKNFALGNFRVLIFRVFNFRHLAKFMHMSVH